MNQQPIKKIIIVGGGIAAWMSAAYLDRTFNRSEHKNIQIQVVEDSNHTIEDAPAYSSLPLLNGFLRYLGLPEQGWMNQCLVSFKMASKFEGWQTNQQAEEYWHPIGGTTGHQGERLSLLQHTLHRHLQDSDHSFTSKLSEIVAVCKAGKAPKPALTDGVRRPSALPYSFHFHTDNCLQVLKRYASAKEVEHTVCTIEEVKLNEQGQIAHLQTKEQGRLQADLYIDCSGSAALLIGQSLREGFDSYANCLPCDAMLSMGVPYGKENRYQQSAGGLKPYTTFTALQNGWKAHLPLQSIEYHQYTYSSQFCSKEAAEMELVAAVGEQTKEIKWKQIPAQENGKRKRLWAGNCVAIGGAGGKVENLSCTNLALIQLGLRYLLYFFPNKEMDTRLQNGYNEAMQELYENIRDFEALHYCLTQKEGDDHTFWQSRKQSANIPASLQEKLAKWQCRLPDGYEGKYTLFGSFDHVCVLAGMDRLPKEALPIFQYDDIVADTDAYFKRVVHQSEQLAKKLPTQAVYFQQLKRFAQFQKNRTW